MNNVIPNVNYSTHVIFSWLKTKSRKSSPKPRNNHLYVDNGVQEVITEAL